jgi:hypothetical protein
MPNGKPGDHPLTDLLVHGVPVFNPRVDALVREIAGLGGRETLERYADELYRANSRFIRGVAHSADLPDLEQRLTETRDALRHTRP